MLVFWMRRYGMDRDAEFAREISPERTTRTRTTRTAAKDKFLAGGVTVTPMPVTAGEKVTVKYNGLLAQSGADAVYLHAGFGQRDWHHVSDLPMTQEKPGVWSTTVSLDPNETSRFNFCFKDRANNWDNNYGLNWSVEIHNGQL